MESKKNIVIYDANVWLGLLMPDDSLYTKAQALRETMPQDILIPEYVLLEVTTVLRARKMNDLAISFAQRIFSNANSFLPSILLAHETVILFSKRNDKLSFVDTALLVLSKEYTVITFDKALQKAIK